MSDSISNDLARTLFEDSPDALLLADPVGRYCAANTRASELTGYAQIELLGMTEGDLLPPAQSDGRTRTLRRKSGSLLTIEFSSRTLPDGKRLSVLRDPSASGQSQELLPRGEEPYRALVESALDPMFTSDANGTYLYVNTAAAAMLGTSPADIIGKSVDELFPPDVAHQYRAGVAHVIQTGETLIAEERSSINGRTVWFSSVVQPVRDRDGHLCAAQAVVRDITKLKEAEQALRESEERLRLAVSVAHIGMFDHDHVAQTLFWSPRQREIFGFGLDEPLTVEDLGPTDSDATSPRKDPIYPEDRARVVPAVQRAHDPTGDGIFEEEHRIVRRDGTVRWITVRAQTFFDGEGAERHAVRTVGAVHDVTADKQAETERERLQAQLVQAQKMESIGRLAGGVAHDFNNMLNVIQGYAELGLAELEPDSTLRTALEEVQRAAHRSADLTQQLLAFARRQKVTPKVLDLNDVVAGSLKMLRRLIGEQINQVWEPSHGLWAVRMDAAQVDQILANLAANARDAIAGVGEIVIRTKNVEIGEKHEGLNGIVPGKYVMLEMHDDGPGIDKETLAHIFEPFYTTKPEGQGTGLGLATVYGIVKQNNGFIYVDSELGKWTRVRIYLPRFEGQPVDAQAGEHAALKKGSETVLLVEDEPMVLRLSRTLLERLGYTVLVAATPGDAVKQAAEHSEKIHLLITDVVMPEMNGPELARRLLSLYPHLKCLFVSGYSASTINPMGELGEDVHFLQKPFRLGELAAKIRETLEKPHQR